MRAGSHAQRVARRSTGPTYFLWDEEHTTLPEFERRLRDPDPLVRAYNIGKLMRQAKPGDVFTFITKHEIRALWPETVVHLGLEPLFREWTLAQGDLIGKDAR